MKKVAASSEESFWGLFHVSDKWWCKKGSIGGLCNVKCEDLLTDVVKNAKCGSQIYLQDGINAWRLASGDCLNPDDESISECLDLLFQENYLN